MVVEELDVDKLLELLDKPEIGVCEVVGGGVLGLVMDAGDGAETVWEELRSIAEKLRGNGFYAEPLDRHGARGVLVMHGSPRNRVVAVLELEIYRNGYYEIKACVEGGG